MSLPLTSRKTQCHTQHLHSSLEVDDKGKKFFKGSLKYSNFLVKRRPPKKEKRTFMKIQLNLKDELDYIILTSAGFRGLRKSGSPPQGLLII